MKLVVANLATQWHEHIHNDIHTSNGQAARVVFLCTWHRDITASLNLQFLLST